MKSFKNMSLGQCGQMIASDPVTCAMMYDRRTDNLLKQIISKSNILGEVEDYAGIVEFQARDAPHTHLMLWVKDAPKYGTASKDSAGEDSQAHEIVMHLYNIKAQDARHASSTATYDITKPSSSVTFHSHNFSSHQNLPKIGPLSCKPPKSDIRFEVGKLDWQYFNSELDV